MPVQAVLKHMDESPWRVQRPFLFVLGVAWLQAGVDIVVWKHVLKPLEAGAFTSFADEFLEANLFGLIAYSGFNLMLFLSAASFMRSRLMDPGIHRHAWLSFAFLFLFLLSYGLLVVFGFVGMSWAALLAHQPRRIETFLLVGGGVFLLVGWRLRRFRAR